MLLIDAMTNDKNRIMRRLDRLVSVNSVEDGGHYGCDPAYSQVLVDCTMTEEELEHWLWKNNFNYIGVVEC